MKHAFQITLLITAILGSASVPAWADAKLSASPEWSGIQQILKNLGSANQAQLDVNFNRSILDILDMKGQIESREPLIKPAQTTTTLPAKRNDVVPRAPISERKSF